MAVRAGGYTSCGAPGVGQLVLVVRKGIVVYKPKPLLARRRLLAVIFILAGLFTVSLLNNINTSASIGTSTATVGIAQTPSEAPSNTEIDTAVRQAIALAGGLPANVQPGKKIVIQPNLVLASLPSSMGITKPGMITNAQVIRTILKMCNERGVAYSDMTICEGSANFCPGTTIPPSGFTTRTMTKKAVRDCGLDIVSPFMVEDMYGVAIVDANDCGTGSRYPDYPGYTGSYNTAFVTRILRGNYLINRAYYIPKIVADCDVLIRCPVLKNHQTAGITGSLKLAFGFGPTDIYHQSGMDGQKERLLHRDSWGYGALPTNSRGMCDMTYARVPDLIVMDGLSGVQNGPAGGTGGTGGEPEYPSGGKMRAILASTDPVAVDTIQALACGYVVSSIPALPLANSLGLGANNPGKITVKGVHVKTIRRWMKQWGAAVVQSDHTDPTLTDLSIADGTHVCGGMVVDPSGYSDTGSGLCKGELAVDGEVVDSNNVTFTTAWTAAGIADGAHTLTYTIYDNAYNEKSLSRTFYMHSGDPIKSALTYADNTNVAIGPVQYTGVASALDTHSFYVSSAASTLALRVFYGSTAPNFTLGQSIIVYGSLQSTGGHRYLSCTYYMPVDPITPVNPRAISNRALGGGDLNTTTHGVYMGTGAYNLNCLVKAYGKVSAGGSNYFYIDDGSLATDAGGSTRVKVICGTFEQPPANSYVSVVGWSSSENGGAIRRVLVARSASEIVQR